jgi:hypothetical protein
MGTRFLSLLALVICLGRTEAASERAVLEVAPSLGELGAGWTTNSIVALLDAKSQAPGTSSKRTADPKGKQTATLLRDTGGAKGQMGWVRMEYGRGDLVLNRGAYFVSIQRWGNTNALEKAWSGWKTRPDYMTWRGPAIGEACYWTEYEKYHGLTFRRGLFHIVVSCGSESEHSGLLRLAEVIDAKIAGRPIPKAEVEADQDAE